MCGIFWYKGQRTDAHKILVHGLERLEYRGYDSAWILVWNNEGSMKLIRAVGKVSNLANKVAQEISDKESFTFGIAHTRRATHGWVTEENTHPHHDIKNNNW